MRATVHCHLELRGKPLCQSFSYYAAEKIKAEVAAKIGEPVTCSYTSLAAARRAKRGLEQHGASIGYGTIKVVRGECPSM